MRMLMMMLMRTMMKNAGDVDDSNIDDGWDNYDDDDGDDDHDDGDDDEEDGSDD